MLVNVKVNIRSVNCVFLLLSPLFPDMIFVQGIDVLFKVALMLLVNHRALILQCNSFESVVDFLKTTLPEMVQVQMERVISQVSELSQDLQLYIGSNWISWLFLLPRLVVSVVVTGKIVSSSYHM